MGIQSNMVEILRAYKKDTGKTMAELSEELGIAKSSLQGYISGSSTPSIGTVEHIAGKLHIDSQLLAADSFPVGQMRLMMNLMDNYNMLASLSTEKRHRYAELLLEILALWDDEFPS